MGEIEELEVCSSSLGRLKRVELRNIWSNEAADFTPWLANPDNLQILSDALGLELEPDSVEKEVGSFYADIVCKDIGTDSIVLIENQLEKSDHDHLGKLLTYAAGLQAATVIWLAERFRDEHRAALDWLNEVSHQSTSFFGLEIELWRIDDSSPAPKFNIVSMPNDWSRSVAQATADNTELSELRILQRKYWDTFLQKLREVGGPVNGNRRPQAQQWMDYGIGMGGFHLSTTMNVWENRIRVELYIEGDEAVNKLDTLEQRKAAIENEFGFELVWGDQSESARDRRISFYLNNVDPKDEATWPRQHKWLAENLNKLHQVFAPQLGDL